jgi:hypothetical protein
MLTAIMVSEPKMKLTNLGGLFFVFTRGNVSCKAPDKRRYIHRDMAGGAQ